MDDEQNTWDTQLKNFTQVCRTHGLKITHQRQEVFREVVTSKEHPDAGTIYTQIKKRIPSISLDTVYRTLWLLNELSLVDAIVINENRIRFDANIKKHHHFICKQCGRIYDFYCDAFTHPEIPKKVQQMGTVDNGYMELHGQCNPCCQSIHSSNE